MFESGWVAEIDARARHAKRSLFAESRRQWKLARERVRNSRLIGRHLVGKVWRRLAAAGRRVERRVHKFGDSKKRLDTYRAEWTIERELARIVSGSEPLIVGPWLSEVGFEVLYWVPFLRRLQTAFHIEPERMTVVTRGGASAWYHDLTPNAVELFDLMTAEKYAERNARRSAEGTGTLKQWSVSSMDEEIIEEVKHRAGLRSARVLHPSLLYRLFHQFWLGYRPHAFLERRTKYRLLDPPAVALPPLPAQYVAVKFYTAASLRPTDSVRRSVQSIVLALAEKTPVVILDTGLTIDDHDDYTLKGASRVSSVRDALRPRDNLAVQTAIIAGAQAFVGTCGSLAWLAPMLGIDTTAVYADPRFLHGHLQVARRIYQVLGGGRFSPLDLTALDQLGLTLSQPTEARESPVEAGLQTRL